MSTGHYSLCVKEESGIRNGQLFLHFEPISSQPESSEQVHQDEWSGEQIRDFVRKLGFVDKGKAEDVAQIKSFLNLNQVSCIFVTLGHVPTSHCLQVS